MIAKTPPTTVVQTIASFKNIEDEMIAENGTTNMKEDAFCDPNLMVVIK